jgi:hypothetical protein
MAPFSLHRSSALRTLDACRVRRLGVLTRDHDFDLCTHDRSPDRLPDGR